MYGLLFVATVGGIATGVQLRTKHSTIKEKLINTGYFVPSDDDKIWDVLWKQYDHDLNTAPKIKRLELSRYRNKDTFFRFCKEMLNTYTSSVNAGVYERDVKNWCVLSY
ncbi:hypothetical protein MHSWG343_06910 [Candidatus Mycoplasma haematohominis]|uniref:Uncharacterized protein n=1 Tax=Candidatus Mycoplasma haematohominis TaxID=1494318 RepID=A0A478FQD2_9MOLU|nr:hypothetical protein MHSWG343_06910 [Candidatus Mycoplasma haemohominis]